MLIFTKYLKDPLFPLWLMLGIVGGSIIIFLLFYLIFKGWKNDRTNIFKNIESYQNKKINLSTNQKKQIQKGINKILNLEKELKLLINYEKKEINNDTSISDFDQRKFNLFLEELKDKITILIDAEIRAIENLINQNTDI